MKLWLYGVGQQEEWAHQTSARKESYVEIQAGPLVDQAEKKKLASGERHMHTEYWIPSLEPLDIRVSHVRVPD